MSFHPSILVIQVIKPKRTFSSLQGIGRTIEDELKIHRSAKTTADGPCLVHEDRSERTAKAKTSLDRFDLFSPSTTTPSIYSKNPNTCSETAPQPRCPFLLLLVDRVSNVAILRLHLLSTIPHQVRPLLPSSRSLSDFGNSDLVFLSHLQGKRRSRSCALS